MSRRTAAAGKKHYRDEEESDEDDLENEEKATPPPRKTSRKQKALVRDDEYYAKKADQDVRQMLEELDDAEYQEEEPVEKRRAKNQRSEMTVGSITKIYVENFMCHRKFELTLFKGVNFITGKNGSGKSAIAAALQLCLGASAKNTGRGMNLASLIREGSPGPAILRVTLHNKGPDAYKPELYGDRITVERKIPRTGGASYHLKDAQNKEVSSQKVELINMLRCLDVHVDNPCCVLTQEESKKFIQGKEHDKYDFFLKATGLETVKEELMEVTKTLDETENDLQLQSKKIEPKRKHVNDLQAQLAQLEELETMEHEIKRLGIKALWDDHRVAQAVLEKVEEEVSSKIHDLNKAKHNLEVAMSCSNTKSEDIETLNDELAAIQERQTAVEETLVVCARKANEAMRAVESKKNDNKRVDRQKMDYEQRLKTATAQINESRAKALQKAEKGERELLEHIQRLESQQEALRAQEDLLHQQRQRCHQEEQRLSTECNRGQSALRQLGETIARTRKDLQQMQSSASQSSTTQRATLLNHNFPALLQVVERTAFTGPVIGPIGLKVQLREGCEQWSAAVERVIGAQLSAFVVTNAQDRQRLDSLMRQTNASAPIIMQAPGPRYNAQNCSQYTQGLNTLTVLDAVVCGEDLVFNCLVDQAHIEKVLLVANENDVLRDFVERDGSGRDRLRFGAASVVTQNATLIKYAYGNQSSEASHRAARNLLAKDMSSIVQSLQQNLQRLAQEEQENKENYKALECELQQMKSQIRSFEQQLREGQQTARRVQRDKERIEDELREQKQAQDEQDTTLLEQEAAELQDAIDSMATQLRDAKEELARLTIEARERQREKHEAEERRAIIERELAAQDDRIQGILRGREKAKQLLDRLQREVDEKQRDLEATEKDAKQARDNVITKRCAADERTKEIDPEWNGEPWELLRKETRNYLEKRRKEMEIDLREGMKRAGLQGFSVALLRERYHQAQNELQDMENRLTSLHELKKKMETENKERRSKWMGRLKKASRQVKEMFDRYVREKGSTGTVDFDHKEKTLTLQFQVDEKDQNTKANHVQNLSGGERSFVTFSLQLALGHVIESPFRLWDEYDVFLDSVARRLTLDQILAYARSPDQSFRQFIVITPHTLADVKTGEDVHIYKMKDPERQSAVGLQQQTLT